jgi:hypothetical protein
MLAVLVKENIMPSGVITENFQASVCAHKQHNEQMIFQVFVVYPAQECSCFFEFNLQILREMSVFIYYYQSAYCLDRLSIYI